MAQKFLNGIDVLSTAVVDGSNLTIGSTALDVQGTQGQLFSVTNSLTGDLFAVSDISGVPILNVNSSGAVKIDGYIDSDLEVHGQLKITSDGSNAVTFTESGNGDFTIDAPDDIRIDAGGGDVVLRAAGTEFSRLSYNNPGLNIESSQANSNIYLTPNGTGNVYASTDTFIVNSTEGEAASILLRTDQGDDNGDDWYIYNGTDNILDFSNNISGSQVNMLTLTPHATASSSIATFAGRITSGAITVTGGSNQTVIDADVAFDLTDGSKDTLLITNDKTTSAVGSIGPSIGFGNMNTDRRTSAIGAIRTGSDHDNMGLAFFTHPGDGNDDTVVKQFELAHDGTATFAEDITSKGLTVDYTGNRTGDAGILVTNDGDDWGIKVDKDDTADYGILSQTDGDNAIVVRNAAGTTKIKLQGDGSATFLGDVTANNLSGTNTGDQDLSSYLTANALTPYYTKTESNAKFTSTDGTTTGGSDYTFKIADESNFSGNKWYHVATIPNTNGGLHIRGFISNHVESFASQKFDLAIACREGGSGADIEITGQLDVLHNATSGSDRTGIRVIKTADSSYDEYKVYIRTTRYSMVTLRLTQEGSVAFNTSHSSPLTSEPAGLGVELDTSTTVEGNYVVDNSTIKEIFHEGHLPTFAEIDATPTTLAGYGITDAAPSTVVNQTDFVSAANGGTFGGNVTIKHASSPSLFFTDDSPDPDNVGKISVANAYMDFSLDNTDATDSSRMRFRLDGSNTVEFLPNTTYFRQTNLHLQNTAVSNINFRKDAAITAGDDLGKINFHSTNDEGTSYTSGGNIIYEGDGTWDLSSINNAPTRMKVQLRNSSGDLQNAMMLSSNLNANFFGDLIVAGNLVVSGTTTTLKTQTVEVEDNIIQLNTTQGSPDTATATTSGISIYRGLDANDAAITQASLIFDDADDTWDLTNDLTVAGDVIGASFAVPSGASTGFLKADGSVDSTTYSGYGFGSSDLTFSGTDPGDIVWRDGNGDEVHRIWSGTNDYLTYRNDAGTAYGIIHEGFTGYNNANWDTAYTHSQAAHAPSNAEANVYSTATELLTGLNTLTNPIFTDGLSKKNSRYHSGITSEYPLGHYAPGETLFEIDPTWDVEELKSYFNSDDVSWATEANAPGGYSIYINGQVGVGTAYSSGFPLIPIDEDATYYQECWIKNAGSGQTHYMGSTDLEADLTYPDSGSGNPGSYGYWVMSNQNPTTTWTKVSGYITGHHASNTGAFENNATYFSPLALFNWGAGTGTRACYISGWKVIRVDKVGDRIFQDDVQVKGKLEVHTLDTNTSSATALVMNNNEVEKRDLGSLAFSNATIPTDHTGLCLPIGGGTLTGDLQVNDTLLSNQSNTDIDSAASEVVAQVSITAYTAAFFDFVVKKGTNVRSGTVYACHDGTNVEFTETSTADLGDTSDVVLSVDKTSTNLRLIATVASNDWSVKSLIRAI